MAAVAVVLLILFARRLVNLDATGNSTGILALVSTSPSLNPSRPAIFPQPLPSFFNCKIPGNLTALPDKGLMIFPPIKADCS